MANPGVIIDGSQPQGPERSSSSSQYCTCHYPRPDDCFVTFRRATDSLGGSHQQALWVASSNDEAQRLRRACQEWGFCHVRVPLDDTTAPSKAQVAASLFDAATVAKSKHENGITFRGRFAESGGDGGEPKESWEYHRRRRQPQQEGTKSGEGEHKDIVKKQIEEWTEELHAVAIAVAQTLYGGDANEEWWKYILDASQESQEETGTEKDAPQTSSDALPDLLRVFCYDAVSTSPPALGSSPHTDWGSLTVVWQSSQGLQVYCPKKDVWNDVPCPDASSCFETFVVHVGDFVSLATGQSRYPSPRHQVVCPSTQIRLSLVYFAYPPRGITLEQAENAWSKGDKDKEEAPRLDYDFYSLLHNQSNSTENDKEATFTCQDEYQRIRALPFDQVIKDKWKQVQRE